MSQTSPTTNSHNYSPLTRRELTLAALACALVAALFLAPTLISGRFLSSADLLFDYYPWNAAKPAGWTGADNGLLSDSTMQFEPWIMYAAERLKSGELPLWNPNNLLGAPFIGNMQSGVFFPLNWPVFLFPGGEMLVFRAWLKLLLCGLGVYVLARAVFRTGPVGAAVSGICYTLGAFMTVWLLHPHTGTALLLPWLLWATARLIDRPSMRAVALLGAVVALSTLAGHTETTYHMAQATGLFALFRIWQTVGFNWRKALPRLGMWLAGFALGGMIAAVQLLPFLEYSNNSMAWVRRIERQDTPFWLPLQYAWTAFSPDLFGNPTNNSWWGMLINYNESNSYSGLLPLLLAPFALFLRDQERRRLALFLVTLGAVSLAVVYRLPGFFELAMLFPGMRIALNTRLMLVAELALALLAGLGVEAIRQQVAERRKLLIGLAVAAVMLLIVGVGVPLLLQHSYFQVPTTSDLAKSVWSDALLRTTLLITSGAILLGAIILLRRAGRTLQIVLLSLLPLFLLADLRNAHAGYMPNVAPADYYPSSAAIRFLQQQQGVPRFVSSVGVLPANTNLAYGLSDLRGDDALQPPLYYQLAFLPALKQDRGVPLPPSPLFNLLNVRYLLVPPGEDPNYVVGTKQEQMSGQTVGEIVGDVQPGQTFVASGDNLAEIQILGATFGGRAKGRLVFHLRSDPASPDDLVRQELDAAALPDNSFWSIKFPTIREARGKSFYFYFEAFDSVPGAAATLWISTADVLPNGERLQAGQPAGGELIFRTFGLADPDSPWFVPVQQEGITELAIFENTRVLPRAWLTHAAEVLADPAARPARLIDPAFDFASTALLAAALPDNMPLSGSTIDTSGDAVNIVSYKPEAITITTRSNSAGLLMLSDQAFPGWEAHIDGVSTAIVTADHALRAVYLEAGEHVVTFEYRPLTFIVGAALSTFGLIILLVLLVRRGKVSARSAEVQRDNV